MFGYPPIHTCSSLQMTKIDADDKNRHGGWEPKKCLKNFFFLGNQMVWRTFRNPFKRF